MKMLPRHRFTSQPKRMSIKRAQEELGVAGFFVDEMTTTAIYIFEDGCYISELEDMTCHVHVECDEITGPYSECASFLYFQWYMWQHIHDPEPDTVSLHDLGELFRDYVGFYSLHLDMSADELVNIIHELVPEAEWQCRHRDWLNHFIGVWDEVFEKEVAGIRTIQDQRTARTCHHCGRRLLHSVSATATGPEATGTIQDKGGSNNTRD